jgi:hypothetical protein
MPSESLQQIEALQTQHHADEQTRQHDDDQRARTGVVDLMDDEPRARKRRHALHQQSPEKNDDRAEIADHAQDHAIVDRRVAHRLLTDISWVQ